jgi:uncharacterized protein YecT (DUF1311 family)
MKIRTFTFLLWQLAALCICHAGDPRLSELEETLAAAQSQTDMNLASKAIADYVEMRLREQEAKFAKELDTESSALFRSASDQWRAYRSAEVAFEGDRYRGGSIRPLIHNNTFIRITKERMKMLLEIKEN